MPSLLAVSLLVTFACLLPGNHGAADEPDDADSECDRWVDVAVVGAGASGTYSAYKLRKSNLSIEMLEYSNRIGGRMFTYKVPKISDVNIELGTMKFIQNKHSRIELLAEELDLTPVDFLDGRAEKKKYFLRGELLTSEQVTTGNVPYQLTHKEKANQARLAHHYLSELTGFNQIVLTDEQSLKLTIKDGRPLYKLRLHEALDMVASEDGKELLRALGDFHGYWAENASAVSLFHAMLGDNSRGKERTLKEGMSKLPERLAEAFLNASKSHRLTLNRKLESIQKTDEGDYQLELVKTQTLEGNTIETTAVDRVCAKKVILAIPQIALRELRWQPLKSGKVREALEAAMPIKSSKVFMFFPEATPNRPWWLSNEESKSTYALKSDTPFSQMVDFKMSERSKHYVMLASCSDMDKAEFMEALNSEGARHPTSESEGHRASQSLVREIISHLSEALVVPKTVIKLPLAVVTQFWSKYPFGGGWSIMKAGYNPQDVKQAIQHPSLTDEVFTVGSDLACFQSNTWGVESALASVDQVFEKYGI